MVCTKPISILKITKTWDNVHHNIPLFTQGNLRTREIILKEFIKTQRNKTGTAMNGIKIGPELEKELVNGASLFLTRITAWLRLR